MAQNILMLDVLDPEDPSLGEFRRTDLSSSTDTAQAMAWAMGDDRRITRVVNCAGIVSTDKIEDVSSEDFDRVMAINVRSYVEVMRAVTPAMKTQGFGRVVNIASRAALGYSNLTSYAASKAAVGRPDPHLGQRVGASTASPSTPSAPAQLRLTCCAQHKARSLLRPIARPCQSAVLAGQKISPTASAFSWMTAPALSPDRCCSFVVA